LAQLEVLPHTIQLLMPKLTVGLQEHPHITDVAA